ncbi:MAG: PAS domain-containing protein [Herminiimonas sp.]|nr:PAS domain-containing protein [Herminiimonas sp.]
MHLPSKSPCAVPKIGTAAMISHRRGSCSHQRSNATMLLRRGQSIPALTTPVTVAPGVAAVSFHDHDTSTVSALLIAVSENTNDPIFVKNCSGELIFANPATLRMLGKTREEALYRTTRDLLSDPQEAARVDQDDRHVLDQRTSLTSEQTLHLPCGVRTYSTTKAPWIDGSGKLMGLVGISTDISARKEAEDSLRARERQLEATIAERTAALRELTNHIETIREEEKRAIARELHDDMGATLTSLSMHLQGAYALFPGDEKWSARKSKIQSLLAAVVETTRRLQTNLRPTMLDLFGLKTALGELLTEFGEESGLTCKLSLPDDDLPIDPTLEIALYRMLQEILNNVVKHAKASKVDVILDIDEDQLTLTVRDDGVGIDEDRLRNTVTHGLRGLHERASYLGGSIRIKRGAGGGTIVAIDMPLPG